MTKSSIWKIIFILFLALISFSLITPFEDQNLGDYAISQASTSADASKYPEHESFSDVYAKLSDELDEGQQIDYRALREYGQRNQLDYAAYFQPPKGVVNTILSRLFPFWKNPGIRAGHVKDRNNRNDLVLRTLLTNSQAAIKRGLDLRGGVAFTMEVTDLNESAADQSGASPMDKVVEIMSERLNAFGVAETLVRKKGDNAIEIQIPDKTSKENPEIIEGLQKPAKLEFRIVNVDSNFPPPSQEGQQETDDEDIPYVAMLRSDAQPDESPIWVRRLWSADGEIVEKAYARPDEAGGWEVGLDFTSEGGDEFGELTGEIAQMADPTTGAPGRLAIVLDGQLESAPTVKEKIDGGSAVISGNFSYREAKMLADILNNPLKVSLTIGEKYEVSPTLAAGALDSSLNACILGSILVISFMVLWYKIGGVVAVFSVGTNVLLVVALLAGIFQATFTLPGMAAIVLTIGMAVDANILIFERIREELRAGKSSENALEGGYAKAFSTIIDANLTTLITASILIWLGTGPVKGFGITLAIGIVTSVFCALFVSKTLLRILLQVGFKNLISLSALEKKKPSLGIEFLRFRHTAFLLSWIVVGIGIFSVYKNKDTILGIDFRGGEELIASFPNAIDSAELDKAFGEVSEIGEVQHFYRSELGKEEANRLILQTELGKSRQALALLNSKFPSASVHKLTIDSGGADYSIDDTVTISGEGGSPAIGSVSQVNENTGSIESIAFEGKEVSTLNLAGKGFTSVPTVEITSEQGAGAIITAVKDFSEEGLTEISGSVSETIKSDAILSVCVALLGILLYVAFRFEMGYAVGAVIATVHDVLMTVGLFVLLGNLSEGTICSGQFTAPMLASILMIVGYSINDTIVVFDRIREELEMNPVTNLRKIITIAINRVLSRSILTSITTLLAAVSLWVFGAGVINDFAFVFVIGILTGTFSSIFIASPIFFLWHRGDRKHVEEGEFLPKYDWQTSSPKAKS